MFSNVYSVQQTGAPVPRRRVEAGSRVEPRELVTVRSERILIPDRAAIVHLQFRRFAGCPVCDLHLQSLLKWHNRIVSAGVREVVVFHSSAEVLAPYVRDLPFAVVADPAKRLYREFGVESSPRALLHPRAWLPITRAVLRSLGLTLRKGQPLPSLRPDGGRFGLPAEFLVDREGRVIANKYGTHAYDQWSVDELLDLGSKQRKTEAVCR
jgi:hypothetical protein